jgi:hypothetical protein
VTRFGYSVAISGDVAIVGAQNAGGTGAAYIFERNQGGANNWGQVKKVTASDGAESDFFGSAVSISGQTAIIGALAKNGTGSDSGAAYIFERNQGGMNNWGEMKKLTASDATPVDLFGVSVGISGDTAIIGATGDDDKGDASGAAYVFERNHGGNNNWGEVKKLTASDGAISDQFGFIVSISGNMAVVGAPLNDSNSGNSGSAYVFERNQGGVNNWGEMKKLRATDGAAHDSFGWSVSINGGNAIIGAYLNDENGSDSGAAYIFSNTGAVGDAFLIFPLGVNCNGVSCTPYTARITAVLDHSAATGSVLAFNGEEGRREFGKDCGKPGYRMDLNGTPFFQSKEINYVGVQCHTPRRFGAASGYLNYEGHSGYDFSYGRETPILAAADGILEVPVRDPINLPSGRDPKKNFNTLRIIHPNGYETWYLHADEGSECIAFSHDKKTECKKSDRSRPQPGDRIDVKAGQQIARIGETGASGAFHLHFEVRFGDDQLVDPYGCAASVEATDPFGCAGKLWID